MARRRRSAGPPCHQFTCNILVRNGDAFKPATVYLHPVGHSLTVIGLEKRKNGAANLLVFDPMFRPSPGILRLVGTRFRVTSPDKLLKAYRRGDTYLEKHNCFELLK